MGSAHKPKGYWTAESCISEITRLNTEGFDLSAGNTRTNYGSLYTKSLQLIGSWEDALKLAGLDYKDIQKKKGNGYWTKENVSFEIKQLYETGEDLSSVNILKINSKLYRAAIKVFGSWRIALAYSNIDYQIIKRKKENNYWTKETVKNEIERLVEAGSPLNASAIEHNSAGLYNASIRNYGSWENALTSIGFDYSEIRLDEDDQKFFGKRFEKMVYEIFDELSIDYIKNKEVSKGLRPDILMTNGMVFDVKLSNYTDWEGRDTTEKYGCISNGIGIIFLRGDHDSFEYTVNNVIFRHVFFYTKQLTKYRRNYYEESLSNLLLAANGAKKEGIV